MDRCGRNKCFTATILTREELKELISHQPVTFIIANLGDKLRWINETESYEFWKSEAQSHVPEEEEFSLDDFQGHYAYIASEWSNDTSSRLILLEVYH